MPDCQQCGARLPADKDICNYCGTRTDVNFRKIHDYTVEAPYTDRTCPRCSIPLRTLNLSGTDERFLVEQCKTCFGVFLDLNELEALVDETVQHAHNIDWAVLERLVEGHPGFEEKVSYIKCPVCGVVMNRVSAGHFSGVVMDRCRDHGVWMDGGELRRLFEARKAGGHLRHELYRKQTARKPEKAPGKSADLAFLTLPRVAGGTPEAESIEAEVHRILSARSGAFNSSAAVCGLLALVAPFIVWKVLRACGAGAGVAGWMTAASVVGPLVVLGALNSRMSGDVLKEWNDAFPRRSPERPYALEYLRKLAKGDSSCSGIAGSLHSRIVEGSL